MDAGAPKRQERLAEVAKQNGWQVSWPSKTNGGQIHVPALALDADEVLRDAEKVEAQRAVSNDETKLERLAAERTPLNRLLKGSPEFVSQGLVTKRV